MMQKIRIILKNSSNQNFSEFNFLQRTHRTHFCIFPRSRALVMTHFPICDVVKIDWQMPHKVTWHYVNTEYWHKLVHKLRKFELVMAQEKKLRGFAHCKPSWANCSIRVRNSPPLLKRAKLWAHILILFCFCSAINVQGINHAQLFRYFKLSIIIVQTWSYDIPSFNAMSQI